MKIRCIMKSDGSTITGNVWHQTTKKGFLFHRCRATVLISASGAYNFEQPPTKPNDLIIKNDNDEFVEIVYNEEDFQERYMK